MFGLSRNVYIAECPDSPETIQRPPALARNNFCWQFAQIRRIRQNGQSKIESLKKVWISKANFKF